MGGIFHDKWACNIHFSCMLHVLVDFEVSESVIIDSGRASFTHHTYDRILAKRMKYENGENEKEKKAKQGKSMRYQ